MIAATAWLSETCRLYIAVVFLLSAGGKAAGFREFERTVTEGANLPPSVSRYIALAVIVAEGLAASLSLMPGAWARSGVTLALFLTLMFTAFIVAMLAQGKSIRCNCFGQSGDRLSPLDLLRNGLLMAACAFYLFNVPTLHSIPVVAWLQLLAMASIAFLITVNLKGIVGILRMG